MSIVRRVADSMQQHRLTERQQQVALMYVVGVPRTEIAERLFLSPSTVSQHLTRVLAAYGLAGKSHMMRIRLLRVMLGLPANDLSGVADWSESLLVPHLRGAHGFKEAA